MSSVQERLQLKRVPLDKWSVQEQLCLASAVAYSGDQNWMSVSRSLKLVCTAKRPSDWYSQKSCAAQYGKLLENVETPKRKKRNVSERDTPVDTPGESIVRKLNQERINELRKIMTENQQAYDKLQEEIALVQQDGVDEERLQEMWSQIESERKQREKEQIQHAQWLKEREERKLEQERAWRPNSHLLSSSRQGSPSSSPKTPVPPVLKIKFEEPDVEEVTPSVPAKASISPLLSSLLKSPSPAPNSVATTSHTQSNAVAVPAIAKIDQTTIFTPTTLTPEVVEQVAPTAVTDIEKEIKVKEEKIKEEAKEVLEGEEFILNYMNCGISSEDDEQQLMNVIGIDNIDDLDDILSEYSISSPQLPPEEKSTVEEIPKAEKQEVKADTPAFSTPQEKIENIIQETVKDHTSQAEPVTEEPKTEDQLTKTAEPEVIVKAESPQTAPVPETIVITESSTESDASESQQVTEAVCKREPKSVGTVSSPNKVPSPSMSPKVSNAESPTPPAPPAPHMLTVLPASPEPAALVESNASAVVVEKQQTQEVEKPEVIASIPVPAVKVEETDTSADVLDDIEEIEEIMAMTIEPAATESLPASGDEKLEAKPTEVKTEKVEVTQEKDEPKIVEEDDKNLPEIQKPLVKCKVEVTEDGEIFEDAQTNFENELETEKPVPFVESKTTQAELAEEEETGKLPSTVTIIESDDDTPIEVIKEDKVGKTKRDYSRKKHDSTDTVRSRTDDTSSAGEDTPILQKTAPSTPSSISASIRQKLKERERSESPLVTDDDTSEPVPRHRRRYSSTPNADSVPNSPASSDDREYRAWKKSILVVYNRLSSHKYSLLFLRPTTEDQSPGFKAIVRRPMDLQTIKRKIETGHIRTTVEFQRDVMLMCQNTIMFNRRDNNILRLGKDLMAESVAIIESTMEGWKREQEKVATHSTSGSSSVKGRSRKSQRLPI